MPNLKPTHKSVRAYYDALAEFASAKVGHELAVRSAFQNLLADTARSHGWLLVPEEIVKVRGKEVRPDGTLRDQYNLHRGYWEAKDTADRLEVEISKKIKAGYPLTNIIFEDTREARLYRNGEEALRADMTVAQDLADLLNAFFAYTEPDIEEFEHAVEEFKERVPDLAKALAKIIAESHKTNRKFQEAFDAFFTICETALNPNISQAAVDEMLVQHLLTERLIRKLFDPHFTQRNVIAVEVEKVIEALASKAFNRDEFLRSLDKFYRAIEHAGENLADYTEKQHFLNTVYERFFQGYSVKLADTHGIVYTPQPIVDFMCASVAEVLQTEFGKSLGDEGVNILDPCTGTGNFIVNLMRRIPKRDLARMYRQQLFANEVMLLPYYIAALNIEHAYYELTGEYEPFEGLCFVDTLDLVEKEQKTFGFMTEKNTQRVERQRKTPITVIIGNPPYNAWQVDENDNNKNRTYDYVDNRVRDTYAKDSRATNKNPLWDVYVKFFRWAVDRLGARDGIVCFISNNSFVEQHSFDGMRKHLAADFTTIYHLHLEGNVRQNPKLAGTVYNVFGIQVGVGITVAVRSTRTRDRAILFHRLDKLLRRENKLAWLHEHKSISGVPWVQMTLADHNTWRTTDAIDDFGTYLPIATKAGKSGDSNPIGVLFRQFSVGIKTNRDESVYDFNAENLRARAKHIAERYNTEVDRYRRASEDSRADGFEFVDELKWSESLKAHLRRGRYAKFENRELRACLYRPFCKRYLWYDDVLVERRYQFPQIYPPGQAVDNTVIVISDVAYRASTFSTLVANGLVDIHLCASLDGHQCFPFYVYEEDGSNRRENITDWALDQFRQHYAPRGTGVPPVPSRRVGRSAAKPHQNPPEITKWDIFYYVYGLLHHPGYRERYAENLRRELPRIPFAPALTPSPGTRYSGRGPG